MKVSNMRPEHGKSQRGVALLITLAFIAVLIATALELNRRMRDAVEDASSTRDMVRAKAMASSGVHAVMALLVLDKSVSFVDSVQDVWADPEKIAMMIDAMSFEEGRLEVKVSDELGRIQVNALVEGEGGQEFDSLQKALWLSFLDVCIDEDEQDDRYAEEVVDSIKDWIDSGDGDAVTGLDGAESGYYRGLDPPYSCADGYLRDLSELAKIKGVTGRLYKGDKARPGLRDYVTVFGDLDPDGENISFPGTVNINTAPAPVLKALFGPDFHAQIPKLLEYRLEKKGKYYLHGLSDPDWYKEVPGFQTAVVDSRLLAVESNLFRIESVATVNESKLETVALVHRRKDGKTGKMWCKVLSWQVK